MVRKVCYKCDEMRYGRLGLNMVWDIDVTVQGKVAEFIQEQER